MKSTLVAATTYHDMSAQKYAQYCIERISFIAKQSTSIMPNINEKIYSHLYSLLKQVWVCYQTLEDKWLDLKPFTLPQTKARINGHLINNRPNLSSLQAFMISRV